MKMQVLLLVLSATTAVISRSNDAIDSEVFVASGSVAVLPCVMSTQNKLSTAVTWKRIIENEERTVWRRDKSGLEFHPVGQASHAYCPHPNFGNAVYSLHLEGVTEEDAGKYSCEVEGLIKTVMLYIIKVSFTPAEVFEGDQLMLNCKVTPQRTEIITKWELNGSPLNSRSGTYVINKVSQKDAGTWSCLIEGKKTKFNASTSLQVKGILVPQDNSEVVYAELGSSVTLPCIFSNELKSSTWERVSKTSNQPAMLPSSFNNSSNPNVFGCSSMQRNKSAYIESVQAGDEGTYRCSGEVMGDGGKHVKVERDIQLVTAQVLSLNRNGKTTLTCHISSTSQVTSYEWIHVENDVNGNQTFTSVQNSTSKVLSIPKTKHQGEWVCRFYNQRRLLGNVTYHQQVMSRLEGQQKSTSGKNIAIILGLCFLFMLLVLIMLQLCKNHRRRKMIMQYPAMETIVHHAANEREFRERAKGREKTQTSV